MEQKRKLVLMGNDAVGEAALRCGCTFFAGYPISPQTQILDYLAREMPKRGCTFLQADSELGAINMVIGASIAGARALTVSSSTGLALMYEAFAAAADGEFPMVIMDVTREGAAQTGIKASQSDYNMLTKSFGDGGLRVPVLTPSTVQELAELVGLAFDMADRYRTPVVIMTEPTTAQTIEAVDFDRVMPDKHYDKTPYTPSGRDTRPIPGSLDEHSRYIAAKPAMETLHDIVIFREMLEPFTVKLATKYATEDDLAELGRLLEGFRQIDLTAAPGDDDIRRFVDVEMAFHDRLSKMCRNPYLINAWQINRVRIIQQVWLTYKSFFDRTQSGTHHFSKDHPYQLHHQLYSAICERNEQMAMGSVFTHQRNLDLKIYLPYTME